MADDATNPYSAIRNAEQQEKQAQLRYMAAAVVEGLTLSKQPLQERAIRLKVFVGDRTPWMVSSVDDVEPKALATMAR